LTIMAISDPLKAFIVKINFQYRVRTGKPPRAFQQFAPFCLQ
jgi:hypothetical protein